MKKFEDLKEIIENYSAWGSTNRSALSDFGTHRVEFKEQMFRINTFIEGYFDRPILDNVGAFNSLRAKMNIVGLDFTFDPSLLVSEGSFEFPITRHGGSFGTKPDHDLSQGFYTDDGIPGLAVTLSGSVTEDSTGYRVEAKLVSTESTEDPKSTPQEFNATGE